MQRVINLAILAMAATAMYGVLYAVAPILIPFLLVIAGLGVITWGVVRLARSIERRRNTRN